MTVYDAQKDIYAISSSSIIFAAMILYNFFFFFTLLSVRNFKFSVLTTQLKENNLKQSVIHMNNISEILLNIIFRKYVSVSYGLEKKLTFSSITKSQFSYCRLVWMFAVEHRTT